MGLIKYGLAVGIGYHFGQPHGRQQLLRVRQQIIEFAHKPAITQLRERGWDIAGERALAAKNLASKKLSGKSKLADTDTVPVDDTDPAVANGPSAGTPDQAAAATGSAADGAAATGFGGRTVAEDSHAAIASASAPPPAGRVPPTDPTTGRP
jgi:hypothetical protein